jgi:hypothetical protein
MIKKFSVTKSKKNVIFIPLGVRCPVFGVECPVFDVWLYSVHSKSYSKGLLHLRFR